MNIEDRIKKIQKMHETAKTRLEVEKDKEKELKKQAKELTGEELSVEEAIKELKRMKKEIEVPLMKEIEALENECKRFK